MDNEELKLNILDCSTIEKLAETLAYVAGGFQGLKSSQEDLRLALTNHKEYITSLDNTLLKLINRQKSVETLLTHLSCRVSELETKKKIK